MPEARAPSRSPANVATTSRAAELQALVNRAVRETLVAFASTRFRPNQLAVTLVDLRDARNPVRASYRGGVPIYPASVIKLFYLAAAHQWMEDGRLADTPELRRALHDMIVHSHNEATSYVVDLLTGTTSGPELPPDELRTWFNKRNALNRHFAALGYTGINVNKKPWHEGPYGRETQAIKAFKAKRNLLTTDATARLLTEIVTGKAVSTTRSREMMKLLKRNPANEADHQAQFTGAALPPSAKLWSKAGWTSQTRHDAAYVELPSGAKFVLVTFTVDHANEREIIPTVAKVIIDDLIQRRGRKRFAKVAKSTAVAAPPVRFQERITSLKRWNSGQSCPLTIFQP